LAVLQVNYKCNGVFVLFEQTKGKTGNGRPLSAHNEGLSILNEGGPVCTNVRQVYRWRKKDDDIYIYIYIYIWRLKSVASRIHSSRFKGLCISRTASFKKEKFMIMSTHIYACIYTEKQRVLHKAIRCRPGKGVGADGIRESRLVVLDVSHLPEERLVHKLIGGTNDTVWILHFRHGFSPLLAHVNRWGMHELLLRCVRPYTRCYNHQSQHHVNWSKLRLHSDPKRGFYKQIKKNNIYNKYTKGSEDANCKTKY
jgi:hypothetical protein